MTNITSKAVAFDLKDVTLNFPRLGKAWTPSFEGQTDSPQWSVQVLELDEESLMTLEEIGVALQDTDKGKALNLKAYVTNSKGLPTEFNVFDSEMNEMSVEDRETIGYGSKGHICGYLYKNNYGGVSMRMTDIVITEKVERTQMTRVETIKKRLGL